MAPQISVNSLFFDGDFRSVSTILFSGYLTISIFVFFVVLKFLFKIYKKMALIKIKIKNLRKKNQKFS